MENVNTDTKASSRLPDLTPAQIADLAASGLSVNMIRALGIRPAGLMEIEATGMHLSPAELEHCQPYIIPYFRLTGEAAPHYRIKLLAPLSRKENNIKYLQPKNTPNWVYFPPGLLNLIKQRRHPYLILTEGEKKAAKSVQEGIPAVAFGGVDSWRTRTFQLMVKSLLPSPSKEDGGESKLLIKLGSGTPDDVVKEVQGEFARGFNDMLLLIRELNLVAIITYDTDEFGPNPDVQRAAADLGFALTTDGNLSIRQIRQMHLPHVGAGDKTGLDDYLVNTTEGGPDRARDLIDQVLASHPADTYPRRTDLRLWLTKQLNAGRATRAGMTKLARGVLAELDVRGRRLAAPSKRYYYFDKTSKVVLPTVFVGPSERFVADSMFTQYLYLNYGVGTPDERFKQFLFDAFSTTPEDLPELLEEVEPHRGIRVYNDSDTVDVQLSDSHLARVTPQGISVKDNGDGGTLFLANQVEPVHISDKDILEHKRKYSGLQPWWLDVIRSLNLDCVEGLDTDQSRELAACLFYLSPWINRWRGTQLPLEQAIAEAGSGKSSLYSLRLLVYSGRPELQNVPNDLRDWYAAVSEAPGIWVGDNVRILNKEMRQRLSDELCRLITEPSPTVTLRKLYTTSDRTQIPVNSAFAITSIYPTFQSADLSQRSVILRFKAIPEGHRQSNWVDEQLSKYGGRQAWIMHHLHVLQEFLYRAQTEWVDDYRSHHRLINFEQAVLLMSKVLGLKSLTPECFSSMMLAGIKTSDTTMEGLVAFSETQADGYKFHANHIVEWAVMQEEFSQDIVLNNARRIGRYIQSHQYAVERASGIIGKSYQNRTIYQIDKSKQHK